eukprot:CAMPEP_0205922284 /NCGR_PEP_ID=MMETSP1325-20131115/14211_1 /ASSEMBLY_ACC=CAM_ASM_000708 /TAXON_ID=236786 /ORGANISM="Florenciella sp., Strain RCC1007" /LENGTH=169 /DNA_ID=CAMNT_0053290271 /DNA_START=98 /DNA_END=605 /DNA_ORIENTATION=+
MSLTRASRLRLILQELQEHVKRLRLLAKLGDDGARATHDLGGLAFLIDLAQAAPLAELLAGVDHHEVHATLLAQRAHKLGVLRIVAVLGKAAELGRVLVESLGALVEAARETVVNKGLFEHLLQGVEHAHLLDLNLLGLLASAVSMTASSSAILASLEDEVEVKGVEAN